MKLKWRFKMQLLIDIGNSRFKWRNNSGTFEGALVHGEQSLSAYLDEYWSGLEKVGSCWGCSVANSDARRELDEWCQNNFGFAVTWVQSKSRELGVINHYNEPATLGCDRWVALVSAKHKYPNKPLCVVDAGTAITVDALSAAGDFLGGTIIPGRKLMQRALGHNTARLPHSIEATGLVLDVQAKSTGQAIYTGIELTLQAGVTRIIQEHLTKYQRKMKIIVTGGDAESLQLPYVGIKHEPDLVFDGLKLIASRAD
ncbi:MAG: type III pantothenate kinase [Saprospiraceae bacterium]